MDDEAKLNMKKDDIVKFRTVYDFKQKSANREHQEVSNQLYGLQNLSNSMSADESIVQSDENMQS